MEFKNTLAFAQQLDKEDPLKNFRDQFYIPLHNGKEKIYFDGNSTGLQPKSVKDYVLQELEDWQNLGGDGHFEARRPWYPYHEFFTQQLAALIGCLPEEVVAMNSLTVNIHLLLVSFYRPTKERYKIICESKAFPSDQYALESQVKHHGLDPETAIIEVKPSPGNTTISHEDILNTIHEHKDSLALVFISGINYYTGQAFNIKEISKAAHDAGAYAGFDLAHAAGNIELHMHDWDADFACWCTYKYLNSGPGSVGGIYIHQRHATDKNFPRFAGWWGYVKDTRFKMEKGFDPIPTAEGWQLSNAPVLSLAAHMAALDVFEKAGLEKLFKKRSLLTGYLIYVLDEVKKITGKNGPEVITPREETGRGSQVSFIIKEKGREVYDKLIANGVTCGWREPEVIRVAPVPLYNSFEEVWQFGIFYAPSCNIEMKKEVTIVGAGLVGSLLSIGFARRGYKAKVFERRPDMRKSKVEAGRSINLALSDRGLLALEKVGMAEEIKKIAIPMHGRFIHNQDGTNAFQPYGKQGQFINSVSRATLNMKLMDLAEKEGIEIFFEHACTGVDWTHHKVTFGPTNTTHHFELLFGADGAFSAARLQYQLQHDKFNYAQDYIDCGYKELHIPAGPGGNFQLEKNALHIWPRKEYMLIALPNLDGSFTCTLFFPFEGPVSFTSLTTEEKVNSFFKDVFPDTINLIPDLSKQFFLHPTASLVTIRCYPWIDKDHFALIGDAAHAIVPFFGQGMNCGFEDCRILDELIDKHKDDWKLILPEYQSMRKPDADAIAEMALNNFTEMREKTADPVFLLQKKIEAKLNEKYPDKWIPAYSQVTFSPRIRYSEALQRGRKQDAIMKDIMKTPGIEKNWDQDSLLDSIIACI